MYSTCVVTDSTVIFTRPTYPGFELVQVVSPSQDHGFAPDADTFLQTFSSLSRSYQEIIAVLSSSNLNSAVDNAHKAASELKSPLNIQIIDTQTTAVGLGLLVQSAAESIQRGMPVTEICNQLRSRLRKIFAIFCLPDLDCLAHSGQIDPAQAIVGEMLGIIPIFIIENGQLIHTQKIRSPRHMVDIFYEFVMEFDHLKFLALLQGDSYFELECNHLRERITQSLRTPHLNKYIINSSLASLLGPRMIGIISMQKTLDEEL